MDFIEQLFGFAPDGGNGALEFLLFALPIVGIVCLAFLRRRSRQRSRSLLPPTADHTERTNGEVTR